MRTVELVPGIKSSALGFGCAPILGAVDAATARRAVQIALEEGITHFDVAPSYGYGEAESWLGRELAGRRDDIVLATKYGIVATGKARLLRPLKPFVRLMKKLKNGLSSRPDSAGRPAPPKSPGGLGAAFHARLAITPEGLRSSVETSLRHLRTDRLDYVFLHEPVKPLPAIEELAEEAGRLKAAGKIRGWGLAYMRAQGALHETQFSRFDVLQFDLSPGNPDYETVRRQRESAPNVFFAPFRELSPDISRVQALQILGAGFPRSVILCSMFSPEHIRANARAL